ICLNTKTKSSAGHVGLSNKFKHIAYWLGKVNFKATAIIPASRRSLRASVERSPEATATHWQQQPR
ncbi:hypothetical protein GN958_ATG12760, partial [Phytophthora infestans]